MDSLSLTLNRRKCNGSDVRYSLIDAQKVYNFNSVHSMIDQLTAMERIANTPIPASYGIHLKQVVTVYLFALPMTLARLLCIFFATLELIA